MHTLNLYEQFRGAEGITRDRNELGPKLTHSQFVNRTKTSAVVGTVVQHCLLPHNKRVLGLIPGAFCLEFISPRVRMGFHRCTPIIPKYAQHPYILNPCDSDHEPVSTSGDGPERCSAGAQC